MVPEGFSGRQYPPNGILAAPTMVVPSELVACIATIPCAALAYAMTQAIRVRTLFYLHIGHRQTHRMDKPDLSSRRTYRQQIRNSCPSKIGSEMP